VERSAVIKWLVILEFGEQDSPDPKEVKERWKKLCQKHHPDKGGDTKEFIKIMHAYNMLTDLEYRHKNLLEEVKRQNHNGLGDLNIRLHVPVTFEDAFFGRPVSVSYNRLHLGDDMQPLLGQQLDVVSSCIQLPPGSVGGMEILLQGQGHLHKGTYGNALIVFMPMPHAKFRVQGGNVVSVESVPLETMLRGGKIEVTTLYGLKTVRVRPATRPGSQISIKGCGVGGGYEHVVQIDALFPSREALKTGNWQGLGIDWEEVETEDLESQQLQSMFSKLGGQTIIFTVGG